MTALNTDERERTRGRTRKSLNIERKKPRKRFRGIPPPPTFDLYALPPKAVLNETETAASVRRSKACLENWRKDPEHPLRWSRNSGRVLYEVQSIREFLKGN